MLNGIEYLEVSDTEAPTRRCASARSSSGCCDQPPARRSAPTNVSITGGERIADVGVEWVAPADGPAGGRDARTSSPGSTIRPPCWSCGPTSRGDFSRYTLRLVAGAGQRRAARRASTRCSPRSSSRSRSSARPTSTAQPACDVPAGAGRPRRRSTTSPRTTTPSAALMLDRLSLLAPGLERAHPGRRSASRWSSCWPTSPTSSPTARTRSRPRPTSAPPAAAPRCAGHARLVDYARARRLNARAWVAGLRRRRGRRARRRNAAAHAGRQASPDGRRAGQPRDIARRWRPARRRSRPSTTPCLYGSHERFDFWTWGDAGCCLPAGATAATLVGDHPELQPGDVLVLAEVASPTTGIAADADPAQARTPSGSTSVASSTTRRAGCSTTRRRRQPST